MKRAAIYFFYDADGVVDRYVEYMLKELRTVSDYVLVVVNGKLQPEGRVIFADNSDDFFVRQNDMDAPAYKEGIEYITWEELLTYDELILVNSTIYGPFRPMKDIFAEMDNVKCDYWGISRVHRDDSRKKYLGRELPWGYKPEDVITNFHVYRSRLLHSYEFRRHWDKLPEIKTYIDSLIYHEMAFGVEMENAGFTHDTLDRDIKDIYPSPTVSGGYDMLAECSVPFIRRKTIFDPNSSNFDYGPDVPRKVLEYISANSDYDVGMIWENQLRTNSLYDLKNWVGLNRFVSAEIPSGKTAALPEFAVLVCLNDADSLPDIVEYLDAVPDGTHVLAMSSSAEILSAAESSGAFSRFKLETAVTRGSAGEASAFVEGGKMLKESGTDIVSFLSNRPWKQENFEVVTEVSKRLYRENMMCTPLYVENILRIMETEPRAGLLVPTPATHASNYTYIGGTWENTNNFDYASKTMKALGLGVPFAKDKPPIVAYGPAFWFRISAMARLFDGDSPFAPSDDNNVSEAARYVYPLVAQAAGFYSLYISEIKNAQTELLHMTYEAQRLRQVDVSIIGGRVPDTSAKLLAMVQQKVNQQSTAAAAAVRKEPPRQEVSPAGKPSGFKKFVKACMPRGLWNLLRKAKCRALGWGYVEE